MFEWIRQVDKQRTYTYELGLVSTPPIPQPIRYVGMEWVREIDRHLNYFNRSMLISLENLIFSTAYPWSGDEFINIKCDIVQVQGKQIKYKIIHDGVDVITSNELQTTPINLNVNIPVSTWEIGENVLRLILIDEDGVEVDYEFIITKEDRDTFKFIREFKYLEDYTDRENIYINNGLGLKEIGAGEVSLEIPTEGKSRINNIVVEGGGDKVEEIIIDNAMVYIEDLGEGRLYESRILTGYSDILNISGEASLIRSNNKYYHYQNNEFIEVAPTVKDFETYGLTDLSQLVTTTNKVGITMDGGEVLGDGRIYKKSISMIEFKNKYGLIEKINEV